MNYREMLLQDYFDESYDNYNYNMVPVSFNEALYLLEADNPGKKSDKKKAVDVAQKAYDKVRFLSNTSYDEVKKMASTPAGRAQLKRDYGIDASAYASPGSWSQEQDSAYSNLSAVHRNLQAKQKELGDWDGNRREYENQLRHEGNVKRAKKSTNQNINSQLQLFADYRNSGKNTGYFDKKGNSITITVDGNPVTNPKELKAAVNAARKAGKEPVIKAGGNVLFSDANINKQFKTEKDREKKRAKQAGATGAASGVPVPAASGEAAKVSKKIKAMEWAKGHKRQLAVGGAAAAGVAGAGVTASGVKNIADLKNTAKAKALWKASGSNLPFEEWRKKQMTKAGIKTGIGAALTAAGASGAVWASKSKKFNEAENLFEQYELVELEEAYLEGYYGQLLAESYGYDSEYDMIMNESYDYDEYDDDYDDYFDEDFMLPYYG